MKRSIGIFVLAALMLAALAGCAPAADSAQTYGEGDTDITVKAGGEFTIKLDENPTTGYSWVYTISDESIVKNSGDDYAQDAGTEEMAGAGGVRTLVFSGVSAGTATIDMVYGQSWEPQDDDKKISYKVTVE